jgi:hypothetical protein
MTQFTELDEISWLIRKTNNHGITGKINHQRSPTKHILEKIPAGETQTNCCRM